MSLRLRLIVLVVAALVTSIAIGGAVSLVTASRSVETEMRAAFVVARQTVDNVTRQIDTSPDPQRDLNDLVRSFQGNRHLLVSFAGDGGAAAVAPAEEHGKVPRWFIALLRVAPEIATVPVTIGGRTIAAVIIKTDPRNETLEAWDELSGSFAMLALFGVATIPLIYLSMGQALRPLDRLAAAMEQVGLGDYGIRVGDRLTPELARLRDSFNLMAERLAATDGENRRLNDQLVRLQEEERSGIAQDLHDEIGPFLLAINADLHGMRQILRDGREPDLSALLQSVGDAVRHLQQEVRGMLRRLRPIGLEEVGLAEAVRGLIEFWRRRYPQIDYRVSIARDCETLRSPVDTIAYRVVQEGLSNSMRHGRPRGIAISIDRDAPRGRVIVEVADDGDGASGQPAPGYGLIGMEERVRATGGELVFGNAPSGGFSVRAALPDPQTRV
jgi:two-component system, NarL family, sensor histidine kinase UhpB